MGEVTPYSGEVATLERPQTPSDVLDALRSGLHYPKDAEKSVIRTFVPDHTPVIYTGILKKHGFEIHPENDSYYFRVNKDADDMLHIVAKLRSHHGQRDLIHFRDMFPLTLDYFEDMGSDVRGVRSTYEPTIGQDEDIMVNDNYASYMEQRKQGFPPEIAAKMSKTGRIVSSYFPHVVVESETGSEVKLAYYKIPPKNS